MAILRRTIAVLTVFISILGATLVAAPMAHADGGVRLVGTFQNINPKILRSRCSPSGQVASNMLAFLSDADRWNVCFKKAEANKVKYLKTLTGQTKPNGKVDKATWKMIIEMAENKDLDYIDDPLADAPLVGYTSSPNRDIVTHVFCSSAFDHVRAGVELRYVDTMGKSFPCINGIARVHLTGNDLSKFVDRWGGKMVVFIQGQRHFKYSKGDIASTHFTALAYTISPEGDYT